MLQVASALVASSDWDQRQVRIHMRRQGSLEWGTTLLGIDGVDSVEAVLSGAAQFAILNPATAVHSVLRRHGVTDSTALASIATIPSRDRLALAVPSALDIEALEDLGRVAPVLALSLRGERPNHSVHTVVDDVLAAAGLSLDDVTSWGGSIFHDPDIPGRGPRAEMLRSGARNAVFDEAVRRWVPMACEAGLTLLSIGDKTMEQLTTQGYRARAMGPEEFPGLDREVTTVDFSGFMVFTRADTPDDVVTAFCDALVDRQDSIPWQDGSRLPLGEMVTDTPDAPLALPLHRAAKRSWEANGFL